MTQILDQIDSPGDLKGLSPKELVTLAAEIRGVLIRTVANTGGHLASNLGVVELTLALHSVLNSPTDKILWDVGHQSYIHKILTGRKEDFHTLRQWNGISGFPNISESPHDIFTSGHSSTSISSALGLAKARDLRGEDHHIVAVIGDGSMTGGLAFEALNHAGQLKTDLVVILNDNEMSISPNVGALSGYLSRLRIKPSIHRLKETLEERISQIPRLGKSAVRTLEKLEDSLTYLIIPGIIFEELGFTYLGPIDGHNIPLLKNTVQDALRLGGPVLIHVLTQKGKGYAPAVKSPTHFHNTPPFNIETGKSLSAHDNPLYTQIFGDVMLDLGRRDERIVAITAAMPEGTGLDKFAETFPKRFFDVGIAESHAVTMAAGMARGGLRPVAAIYSTFFQRAYDQVVHDVCLQKLPVVFCLDRAGVVGRDGSTHHGVFDLAYLRHLPNMSLMAPKDENEFQNMLWTAINYNDGPVAIRYPRGEVEGVAMDPEYSFIPWGKGEVLAEGDQVVILAIGKMVNIAWRAIQRLIRKGIACTLINSRFIKPLDKELILSYLRRIPRVLTLEDHILACGFGSAVLELLEEEPIPDLRILRLGYPDEFLPHGSVEHLYHTFGLTEEAICRAVESLIIPSIQSRVKQRN
jgi:1-deoxy-D-xylulose-5-phosphate synthase